MFIDSTIFRVVMSVSLPMNTFQTCPTESAESPDNKSSTNNTKVSRPRKRNMIELRFTIKLKIENGQLKMTSPLLIS